MNLGKWLEQTHSLAEQLEVMHSICKAVVGIHQGGSAAGVALAPPRMELDGSGSLHMMGGSIGAPTEYAAPELGEGDDPTPSADVFAIGVIFYEILTARHPFASGGGFDRDIDPTPLRDIRSDLAAEVADAIQACLDKDPDWRPKDLDYLLSALEKSAADGPRPARTHPPTVKPTVKRGTMRPQASRTRPGRTAGGDATADGAPADDEASHGSHPGQRRRERRQRRVRSGRAARAGPGRCRRLLRVELSGSDRRGGPSCRRGARGRCGDRGGAAADNGPDSTHGPGHTTSNDGAPRGAGRGRASDPDAHVDSDSRAGSPGDRYGDSATHAGASRDTHAYSGSGRSRPTCRARRDRHPLATQPEAGSQDDRGRAWPRILGGTQSPFPEGAQRRHRREGCRFQARQS